MTNISVDSDLMVLEPGIFSLRFGHQLAACGTDGETDETGTVFSAASADLEAAGVSAGSVLSVMVGPAHRHWAVLERTSKTSLTLAMAGTPDQSDLAWSIHTFGPQHELARNEILAHSGVNLDDKADEHRDKTILNLVSVRRVAVLGVLALIYRGQANNIQADSDWWRKAEYYESRYRAELAQLAIEWDLDGSGETEQATGGGRARLGRA